MKLSTAVKYGGLGTAILSSQDGFRGVAADCHIRYPGMSPSFCPFLGGEIESSNGRRQLEEGASGLEGQVVIGSLGHNTTELFVATNATNFPKGSLNGTLSVAIPDSEDCTTEAYGKALTFPLNDPVSYVVNEFGRIGDKDGWLKQSISEIQDANSTLPISLADLISGVETEYGLGVYLLSSEKELLACASLKKLDEDTAVKYYELLYGLGEEEAVVKEDTTSSGSKKSGVFVFVSAIAAVGIAAVLGEMLAL